MPQALECSSPLSDEILIERFQRGDRFAFETLVERYKKRIYFFALRLVQDHQEAEDLSQETFLRAYRGMEKFHAGNSLSSWLFTIAANCYRRAWRRRRRFPWEKATSENEVEPVEHKDATHAIREEEAQRAVKRAIEKLPRKQRLVLVLRIYEGLGYEEISGIAGMSISSVKANLSYARKALRKDLEDLLSIGD